MEALTPSHLLLILIAFVLLVGYKKLPDAARSVGRSLRIFRSEMRALDGQGSTAQPPTSDPAEPAGTASAASVAELEREAAAAEELAAQLRARAAGTHEGPTAAS